MIIKKADYQQQGRTTVYIDKGDSDLQCRALRVKA
ncbi:MAG: hypothetical protein ABW069_01325 [Duganella sp.]